jgi:hypothetical protein
MSDPLFEAFVNLELPRRSAFLTNAITGWDDDPNDGGAPAILANSPLGTWFREETAEKWWRKTETVWVETGSGGLDCLIFQPGGVGAGPIIWNTWAGLYAELLARRAAAPGIFVTIFFDDSIVSPAVIPAGAYDLTNCPLSGMPGAGAQVQFADGTSAIGIRWVTGKIKLDNMNTAGALETLPAGTHGITVDDSSVIQTGSGLASTFFDTSASSFVICYLRNGSILGFSADGPIFTGTAAAAFLAFRVFDANPINAPLGGSHRPNMIQGAVGSLMILQIENTIGMGTTSNAAGTVFPSWQGTILPVQFTEPAFLVPNPFQAPSSAASVTAALGQALRLDASGGPIAQTLPAISGASRALANPGGFLAVVETGGGVVTLSPDAGDTINGVASLILPSNGGVLLMSDGLSNWEIVASQTPGGLATASNALIYREGAAETGPVIFGTWAGVMARLADLRAAGGGEGSFEVLMDDSVTSPVVIPANADTTPIAPTAAFTGPAGPLVDRMTLTDSGATFTAADVGKWVTIAGATTPANDGTFLITAQAGTTLEYLNAAGVAEAQGSATYSLTVPHDLSGTTIGSIGVSLITIADGATFTGLRHFRGASTLTVAAAAGSPSPISDFAASDDDAVIVEFGFRIDCTTGGPPLVDTTAGSSSLFVAIQVHADAEIANSPSGGRPVFHIGLAGQYGRVTMIGESQVWRNGLSSVVGAIVVVSVPRGSIYGLQANLLGTTISFVNALGIHQNVQPIPPAAAATAPISPNAQYHIMRFDVSGGGFTQTLIDLPEENGSQVTGYRTTIKEESGTAGLLVDAAGANTIEGSTSPYPIPAGGTVVFVADGDNNWYVEAIVPHPLPEKWGQDNVTASQTDVDLGAKVSTNFNTIKAIRAGSIVGMGTRLSEAITDATEDSAVVTVTINGTPGTLGISHASGTNPSGGEAAQGVGVDSYVAGDLLGIQITTLGSFTPTTTDIEAWLEIA